ncbi:CDP-alcohol phosphatidyltransferase family protein [Spirochaeta dissipatitropha]
MNIPEKQILLTIPNALSFFRLIGVPFLYPLAFSGHYNAFLVWFIVLGATDFLDGKIARYLDQCSAFGSLLDSVADLAYYLSAAFFIIALFPEYLVPNLSFFIGFIVIFIGSILLPYIRFGKVIFLHTFLLKLNGVLVFAVIVLSFMTDITLLVRAIILIYYLAYLELALMFLIYGEISPDTKSIFHLMKETRKEQ